jgi:DNA-binding transcriptional regulator GbsR (MarR family)
MTIEDKKRYQVEISNRFAALEDLDESMNINRSRENIGDNIKDKAKKIEDMTIKIIINHGLMSVHK